MYSNRFALIFFAIFITAVSYAQKSTVTLQGGVQDVFLKRGLFDCRVALFNSDNIEVKSDIKVYEIGEDSMHVSTIYSINTPNVAGNYLIRVQKQGYADGWAQVAIPQDNQKATIAVPMISLRKLMHEKELGEAVVQATRIKVKMRNDTLVYDAAAFNLPSGSKLSHLIEQLPGATMNAAGEIFINGRKIDELTLNSRSFFRGNEAVLLENLPYYTVKELKVFERQHLEMVMRGQKDDSPEYVMDVNLKNEYSLGAMVNAEAAGGTHERYLTRIFGLLLTPTSTVGAFANFNNTNDISRAIARGWNQGEGFIMGNQNKPSTRKAAGLTFEYQSTKKAMMGYPALMESAQLSFDHYQNLDASGRYKECFLPSGSTFERMQRNLQTTIKAAQLINKFNYLPWSLSHYLSVGYKEDEEAWDKATQQWNAQQTMASQQIDALGKIKHYSMLSVLGFSIPHLRQLSVGFNSLWERSDRDYFHRQTTALANQSNDYRHEYTDARTTEYRVEPSLSFYQKLSSQWSLHFKEQYKLSGKRSDDQYFLLSDLKGWGLEDSVQVNLLPSNRERLWQTYDKTNSTASRSQRHENEFSVTLKRSKSEQFPFDLTLTLPLYSQRERLDYHRGAMDTLAHYTMVALHPSFYLRHEQWSLRLGFTSSTPGLMNMIPYRDARNSLEIIEGNPLLKTNQRWNASLSYQPKWQSHRVGMTSGRAETSFVYHLRSVAQGFTYQAQTGATTYRPENVRGNWAWQSSYHTTISLHQNQQWWVDSHTAADVWHSVDYAALDGMADAALNKVETVNLNESLKFSYKDRHTKVDLLGGLLWRRTWGHRPTQTSLSAFDFRYGFNFQQTIPQWKTTLNVETTVLSRRGYGSSAFNKSECVVNASLTQSLWRDKWELTLEGRDLFHQLSNTTYEVNAQGRTETWYRVIPNYLMLHLVYKFSLNPKR